MTGSEVAGQRSPKGPLPTDRGLAASRHEVSDLSNILVDFAAIKKEVPMMTDTSRRSHYALSFTSGALLVREALIVTPIYLREHDWAKVRELIEEDNLLQQRTVASGQRTARETVQRLAVLSDDELELLVAATATERSYLLWAAVCRRYDLIGEFAAEVLRERFLLFASSLGYDDFDSFIRTKALWHEELEDLKDSTLRKLRSNVFRMLTEAGLLSDDGHIQQAMLSARVADALTARSPSDLRFFPAGVTGR